MRFRGIRIKRALPSVRFSGKQNDCPVVPRRVVPDASMRRQNSPATRAAGDSVERTVGSAVPQRESTLIYSLPIGERLVVSLSHVPLQGRRRTHLHKGDFAPIHVPAERREVQPRPSVCEVDDRAERPR